MAAAFLPWTSGKVPTETIFLPLVEIILFEVARRESEVLWYERRKIL